jgi:hypothetical protein
LTIRNQKTTRTIGIIRSFAGALRAASHVGAQQPLLRPAIGVQQLLPLANVSANFAEGDRVRSHDGMLTRLQSPIAQHVVGFSSRVLQVR